MLVYISTFFTHQVLVRVAGGYSSTIPAENRSPPGIAHPPVQAYIFSRPPITGKPFPFAAFPNSTSKPTRQHALAKSAFK